MMSSAEQALVLDDQLAEAWVHLSRARRENGDLQGSGAARERALELDPQNPLVLRKMMGHWSDSHEPERGLAYADELLRVDPLSPVNLFYIAWLELRLDRPEQMERTLDRIRSIDSKSASYIWGSFVLAMSRIDSPTQVGSVS